MALRLRFGKAVKEDGHDLAPEAAKIPKLLATAAAADETFLKLSREILQQVTGGNPLRRVRVRLWNGEYWPTAEPKAATVVLNRPGALREMLSGGSEVTLGEAYLHEAFDVEGDIEAAFELGDASGRRDSRSAPERHAEFPGPGSPCHPVPL
jgi:hypothetical protein